MNTLILVFLRMLYRYYLLYIVLFISFAWTDLYAQRPYLQAKAHLGTIIKHRTSIEFETNAPTYGVDLGFYWQTKGTTPWQQQQHFPRFFVTGGYLDIGDSDILGEAWSLFGGMERNLLRKVNSALHFGFGIGFAYLTKPFDRISNPTNNAIGSHLNNTITLNLDFERRFCDRYLLHLGVHILHYSNGARKLPNLGLNIPGLYVAISPYQGTYKEDFFTFQNSRDRLKHKFAFGFFTQYAQVEIRVPGGPDYPIYIFGADLLYHLNSNNRVSIGYQYGYNSSKEGVDAIRQSITTGHEFLFGPWSLQIKAGFYLNRKPTWYIREGYYFQLSPRYYFFNQSKSRAKFYMNLQLKTHLFVAEYISLGVGMVFKK